MGDVHPHLAADPRFASLAAKPYPWPPIDEPTKVQKPGLGTMAMSAAKAVVHHVATGGHWASEEVKAEREATCRACPKHQADSDRCEICGCLLKAKRAMASEACPDNPSRWGAV